MIDAVFDEIREWFFKKLEFKKDRNTGMYYDRGSIFRSKLSYLLQCTWCTGVWVSIAIYWVWTGEFELIPMLGVAGLQGMIHALEPSED